MTAASPHQELTRLGITLVPTRVHPHVHRMLDRSGVTARIGAGHIVRRIFDAVRDVTSKPGHRRASGAGE